MRQNSEVWIPALCQGFPLCPGGEEELGTPQIGVVGHRTPTTQPKSTEYKKYKKYRGKGKTNSRNSNFSIMLSNMRGFKSKEYSLKKILRKKRPSVLLANETQLSGKMEVNLKAYTTWTRNRSEKGGG